MKQQAWNSKIKFFSKFLGFDQYQFEETFEESYRMETKRSSGKGINLVKNSFLLQNSSSLSQSSQHYDKKWSRSLQFPYHSARQKQIQQLVKQSQYIPRKLFAWLATNRQKMNVKLYHLKALQYKSNMALQQLLKNKQSKIASNQNNLQIVGAYLLSREDILYSPMIENIARTILFYVNQTPIIAYSLITFVSTSEAFIGLSTNNRALTVRTVSKICDQIYRNCGSAVFIKRNQIILDHYLVMWLETFWLCVQENGSLLRQKILSYLLIHKMSFQAVSKVCEATIASLARLINQGIKQKIIYTLTNPKIFIDEDLFLLYLFSP